MANPVPVTYNAAASPVVGGRFIVSEFWRNLAPGWTDITPAGTRPPFGILAFSGSAWDVKGGKLYINGGGHADYGGNEVWEWDYENRATDFVRHYPPDFTDIYGVGTPEQQYAALREFVDNVNWPGAVVIDGQPVRPISRHTYASLVWMPHLNKFTVGGASLYSGMTPVDYWAGVWDVYQADFWYYDPISKTFEYKGSGNKDPQYLGYAWQARMVLDESREKLYSAIVDGGNQVSIVEHNPATNTWTAHNVPCSQQSVILARPVVDTLRDRLIVLVQSAGQSVRTWAYDLDLMSWSEVSTAGTAPPDLNSEAWAVYSTKNDAIYLLRSSENGMSKLSLQSSVWASETINGPTFGAVSGNWFYDKRRKCALVVYQTLGGGTQVFAYKD